jgi:hypothetical protein
LTADLDAAFAPVRAALNEAKWPETEEGFWYGTPSLNVRGKSFCRLKDADTLVLLCPLEEKEMLMELEPKIFFETDHYRGWPAVLARLSSMGAAMLKHRLDRAWRIKAPKRLIAAYDASRRSSPRPPVID